MEQQPSLIGTIVDDRYEVLTMLGAGGMGQVYLCREIGLDRTVSLKLLRMEVGGDADSMSRFEREARAMAALQHEHIVAFLRFGVWQRHPYIVMEHVRGGTLRQLMDSGRLPWQRALTIGSQICAAVGYMHKQGFIHRDLKPSNVMLVGGDSRDIVKVTDFGLVRFLPASGIPAQRLTAAGTMIGTLHYMSPEQVLGAEPDQRCDIYALGCLLFEIVAGAPPLDAPEGTALAFMQVNQAPPRLGHLLAAGECPRALDDVLQTAMAKDPAQRYAAMEDLQQDLDLLLAERPPVLVSAAAPGAQGAGKRVLTSRYKVPALIAACLVTVLSAAYFLLPALIIFDLERRPLPAWSAESIKWADRLSAWGYSAGANQILNRMVDRGRQECDNLAVADAYAGLARLAFKSGQTDDGLQFASRAIDALAGYARIAATFAEGVELDTADRVADVLSPVASRLSARLVPDLIYFSSRYFLRPTVRYAFALDAVAIADRVYSQRDIRRALARSSLALACARMGRKQEAVKILRSLSPLVGKLHSEESAILASHMFEVWCLIGEKKEADRIMLYLFSQLDRMGLPNYGSIPTARICDELAADDARTTALFEKYDLYNRSPGFVLCYAAQLLAKNRWEEGMVHNNKLLANANTLAQVRSMTAKNKAKFMEIHGNYEEMFKAADLAVQLATQQDTALGDALLTRGLANGYLGRLEKAHADFTQALTAFGPSAKGLRSSVYQSEANVLARHMRFHEAAAWTRRSIKEVANSLPDSVVVVDGKMELARYSLQLYDQPGAYEFMAEAFAFLPYLWPETRHAVLARANQWYVILDDADSARRTALQLIDLDKSYGFDEPTRCGDEIIYLEALTLNESARTVSAPVHAFWHKYRECLARNPNLMDRALLLLRYVLLVNHLEDKNQWQVLVDCADNELAVCIPQNSSPFTRVRLALESGFANQQLGRKEAAAKAFQRAHELAKGSMAMEYYILKMESMNAAWAGDMPGALKTYRDSLAMAKRVGMPTGEITATAVAIARALKSTGQIPAAKKLLVELQHTYGLQLDLEGLCKLSVQNLLKHLDTPGNKS